MINMQKAFDICTVSLLEQGCKSQSLFDECKYRSPDGKKCGVGFLIKDEIYTPEIEGFEANEETVISALEKSSVIISDRMLEMLMRIQGAHDATKAASQKKLREYWTKDFIEIAITYDLDDSEVRAFEGGLYVTED